MRARLFSLIAFALFFVVGASAQDFERTVAASPGGSLDLRLEAGGSLVVTGWGRNQVEVVASASGDDAEHLEVLVDSRGDRVTVRAEFDRRNADADVEYEIRVPNRFDLTFWLSGGSVSIKDVAGDLDGQTMGGEVTLAGLDGDLDITTMGGAISLESSRVSGRVKTMGGEISLDDVEGDVDASTMGGAVLYRNVRPLGGKATRVQTMGGDIEVSDAPAGADVNTMGGDITVGSVGDFLKAETMGGDIQVEAVGGWVEAKTMGGDVTVTMVGSGNGDRHVDISSLGGDIELTVPSDFSGEFDIEIEVTGRNADADDYSIRSDFDLAIDRPQSFEGSGSRRQMTISATGRVGGGRNEVRIRTINGNVVVRK